MQSPPRPRLSDDARDAWRALLDAHHAINRVLGTELEAAHGLSYDFYDVMVHLSEATGERLRMHQLAERVLLSRSGVSRLVDRMEAAGLVTRERCTDDRRSFLIDLTDAGWARLREAAPTHLDGVRRHFAAHLDADETATLERALRRIADEARARRSGSDAGEAADPASQP